ncbi:hypothetical protein SLVCU148_0887 [Staphylococcus lugdunensis VCU148]|nr:hypothetical protein SLVCU148_0887 [Staphylococcus lugdunensis VCU148]
MSLLNSSRYLLNHIKIIQNAIIAITLYRKLHHFIQKMQRYHMIVTIQIINDRLQ